MKKRSKKGSLVAYANHTETLVCRRSDEKRMLGVYFSDESGRDVEDYDRFETEGVVEIGTSPRIRTGGDGK